MNRRDSDSEQALEQLERINAVCDEFEDDWLSDGPPPELKRFLTDHPELPAALLFRQLLEVDLDYRSRRSADFSPESYLREFPEFTDQVVTVIEAASNPRSDPSLQAGRARDGGTSGAEPATGLQAGSGTNPASKSDAPPLGDCLGDHDHSPRGRCFRGSSKTA